ncbi:McrC family protein [Gulosibacter sediminis]|uniref:McrC family protein n=1 Tax=Gulosibacter sediminis TaxID=1729695 RepID=UPI0024AD8C40|nr:hypothetical protein [Gulosibacter sediminis]
MPGARVGGAIIDGLAVSVVPKIPIDRLLHLLSEVADPYGWLEPDEAVAAAATVEDAVAALFVRACQQTFRRGLLRSYRRTRQDLAYVRGKILIPQTVRRVAPVPVAVESDVFDEDNLENSILRSALQLVRTSPIVSDRTRVGAHRQWREIRHVAQLRDPLEASARVVWTRQNMAYEQAIRLARIILASGSISPDDGALGIPGFVLNMPQVIEQWVRTRLRRAWSLDNVAMRDSWKRQLWLDEGRRVELQPDLGVYRGGGWLFIGDVKYKILASSGARRDDVYQLNAYLTATGVNDGALVYAGNAGRDETLIIGDRRIHVVSVDLSAPEAGIQLTTKLSHLRP